MFDHSLRDTIHGPNVALNVGGVPTRDAKQTVQGVILLSGEHKGWGLALAMHAFGLLSETALPGSNGHATAFNRYDVGGHLQVAHGQIKTENIKSG